MLALNVSAQNEQCEQPSFHCGPNMKCQTRSWLFPSNNSASVCLPSGESKTYCFSIFSHGRSRRCLLSASRSFVNFFSSFSSSFRALSQASCETTLRVFSPEMVCILAMIRLPFPLLYCCRERSCKFCSKPPQPWL